MLNLLRRRRGPAHLVLRRTPFVAATKASLPAGTRVIEALQRHIPEGFDRPTELWLDGKKLETDARGLFRDRDLRRRLKPGQRLEVRQLPAVEGFAMALAVSLLVTAITTAAALVLNALFGAKPPGAKRQEAESPVYSISGVANRARPGEPIPELFGEMPAVPDLAAQPYVRYEDNEQFYRFLACLGVGEYAILGHLIDSSPVEDFADPNPVTVTVFAPAAHGQTFGVIEVAVTQAKLDAGQDPATVGIYENVHTSVEVGDQDLVSTTTSGSTVEAPCDFRTPPDPTNRFNLEGGATLPAAWEPGVGFVLEGAGAGNDGNFTLQVVSGNRKGFRSIEETVTVPADGDALGSVAASAAEAYAGGIALTLAARPAFLVVTALVTVVYPDLTEHAGTVAAVFQSGPVWFVNIDGPSVPPPGAGSYAFKMRIPSGFPVVRVRLATSGEAGGPLGPFTASLATAPATRRLEVDLEARRGIYRSGTQGNLAERVADLRFTLQPIDGAGDPAGAPIIEDVAFAGATRTPQRRSFAWDVPDGRYAVIGERLDAEEDDFRIQSRITWTGLKAVLRGPSGTVYGPNTLMFVEIRATDGIANAGARRFRTRCVRRLPAKAGTILESDGGPVETRNPADAWWYIAGLKGVARDTEAVEAAWDRWDNDTAAFNGVFDTRLTLGQALNAVLAPVLATTLPLGGQLTILREEPRELLDALYNRETMAPGSLKLGYDFDDAGAPDGVRVEYREAAAFNPAFATWPTGAAEPEEVFLRGITDAAVALAMAKLRWNRRLFQRKTAEWTTGPEGHIALLGDRVGVSHPMLGAAESGLLMRWQAVGEGTELIVDRRLAWPEGESVYLTLRRLDGRPSEPLEVTRGEVPEEADFDAVLLPELPEGWSASDLAVKGSPQPTVFSFGPAGFQSFSVNGAEDAGEDAVVLKGTVYDARVYDTYEAIVGPEPSG